MSGTPLEPGEIVLVPFPFTDLTAAKTRPAVVLSTRKYNAASEDVIVYGMTSNLTLQRTIVRKLFGKLRPAPFGQVLRELHALFPE